MVSGGLNALKKRGLEVTTTAAQPQKADFTAKAADTSLTADLAAVLSQVNTPDEDTVLIDTRTKDEFNMGTIPGSIHLNYEGNNYSDGTIRSVQDIKLRYKDAGILPEDTIILYCKSSIRGAQTFLALYNAGYRNLKLYDGAWLEWTLDPDRPVQLPETIPVQSNFQDNS